MLKMFFWVFPRHQIVVGRRFGTLYRFHLQRLVVDCDSTITNAVLIQFDLLMISTVLLETCRGL